MAAGFRLPFMVALLALVLFITGCAPSGPRELLKGQRLLQQGDYAGAMEQLQLATATAGVATNAQAWNYLGVACQGAGQPAEAVTAYQRALTLDRDLMEAHFNLGSLWLSQNKYDAAKAEFTAYTLRRPNQPEGWLNLGTAQLRSGDLTSAEKSFGTAYYYDTNNAEALNGLGLVQIKRGHSREASQFFAAAIKYHPDYAPALLNQATVAQENLHDNALALDCYLKYLSLNPRPANWEQVNAIVNDLSRPTAVAAAAPPASPTPAENYAPAAAPEAEITPSKKAAHVATAAKPKPVKPAAQESSRPAATASPRNSTLQQVQVADEPQIVNPPRESVAVPTTAGYGKPGVFHNMNPMNWFAPGTPSPVKYADAGVTPLPVPAQKPIRILPAAPPEFPRYLYLKPRKPAEGDRVAALAYFNRAREYEQSSSWTEALENYRRAIQSDPAWFAARYNYGLLAYRLRNYDASLAAYETALVIQPDSVDARYNFALVLKAAGYAVDAVNQLEKIIAVHPDEVRAQLALANLYSQQLLDPARARVHYQKVLALDPGNSQATDIHYWLQSNPP